MLVREGDADLGDGGGGRGWAVETGLLIIIHVDAGRAAVVGGDGQAAVVGGTLLRVEGQLLAGDGLALADLAHGEEGGGQAEEDENKHEQRDEEVDNGRGHLAVILVVVVAGQQGAASGDEAVKGIHLGNVEVEVLLFGLDRDVWWNEGLQ